jgi:hypothetical protein
MNQTETTQLKLTLGAFRLEYEGREDFLKSDVLTLVQALDSLQAARLIGPVNTMQMAIDGSLLTQSAIDNLIATMRHDLDDSSDLSEMERLRLQTAMDRLSQMMITLSNLLKKISDTAAAMVANIK